MKPDLLTIKEAMARYNLPRNPFDLWCASGQLIPVATRPSTGNKPFNLYRASDIKNLIGQRVRRPYKKKDAFTVVRMKKETHTKLLQAVAQYTIKNPDAKKVTITSIINGIIMNLSSEQLVELSR